MSYKIPENNKYYVSNASDLTPNVQFVRNIDMDEEGYLRLSPMMAYMISETDNADIGLTDDVIKGTSSGYKFLTDDKIFNVSLDSFTPTLDASAPSGGNELRFNAWKGGAWYVNAASDIYSLQPNGTTWAVENTDSIDYAEVFVNKNSLVGANGSNIHQYTTDDMGSGSPDGANSGPSLALPGHLDIRGISYSNYRVGIATRDVGGRQAYFFVWDGATSEASQGFPVFAPMILDLIAYKNSWAILTSIGQLLYFNGGGFDVLGNLPCYYSNNSNWIIYGGSQAFGRGMYTDGDVIYFNVGSLMESTEDDSGIYQGFYGGVWCYDPDRGGIYHRYGLSHSKQVTDSVNAASGVYTSVAHGLETGDKIRYTQNKILYAIKLTADTFKIADTYDEAIAGTGSSTNYDNDKKWIKRTDWTQLTVHSTNTGGVIKMNDGTSFINYGVLPFFSSMILATPTLVSAWDETAVMLPLFDNIGTITYAKIKSENLEDTWNSIIVKHKKLTDGDKIVVKYKIKDGYKQTAVGEADDISPDAYVVWTSSTTFTCSSTFRDLSDVEVGDEVEFWSGAGAGSSAHVISATLVDTTWTVVLDEAIRGAVANNKATCLFDSYKKLGTITKDTTGNPTNQATLALGLDSKWIQVKLELRGNNITIEDLIIDNERSLPIG